MLYEPCKLKALGGLAQEMLLRLGIHMFFDQRGTAVSPQNGNVNTLEAFLRRLEGVLQEARCCPLPISVCWPASLPGWLILVSRSPGSGSGCKQAGELLVEVSAAQLQCFPQEHLSQEGLAGLD